MLVVFPNIFGRDQRRLARCRSAKSRISRADFRRTPLSVLGLAALVALSGCESATTKATDERLSGLLASGLEAEKQARIDERLSKTLNKENATGALKTNFAGVSDTGEGQVNLSRLTALALERNSRIGRPAQAINREDALRLNAIFGYLPQVSVNYQSDQVSSNVKETDNAVFQLGQADYPATKLSVRITQPIFDLSRIFGIQYAANARSKAEVEYIKTVRDVSYEVMDAYLVAIQASTRASSLRQRQALVARQVSAQSVLSEEGLDLGASVSSLRSERAGIASEEALEQSRLSQALSDLALLTGTVVTDVERLRVPRGITGTERRIDVETAVQSGLRDNPLVMVAALDVVGTELLRRQAMASDFSPVLSAYALLEEEDREASRFGGGSVSEDTTVGVTLSIPLFNSRGDGIATLPATVDVRQAALEYHAVQRQLETQIRVTHARMGQLSAAVRQSSSATRSANSALAEERRRVTAGESLDLAVASRALRSNAAREREVFQQVEYMRAWARFQYLTGVADYGSGI